METMCYIGLDVHKRKISYCMKDGSGRIHSEGSILATRHDLDCWITCTSQIAARRISSWWTASLRRLAKSFSARACQVSPLSRLGARAQALDAPVE